MTDASAAGRIDEEAALWAVRADAGGLDPATDPELSAWLAADPRRQGAFLRAQAALSLVDRSRTLPAEAAHSAEAPSRRRFLTLGAGAGAVAASAAGLMIWGRLGYETHQTGLGEVRRTPLPDGTLMMLNTSTELRVRFTGRRRQVEMVRGEAWFDIARDAERPFVVAAGEASFQAIGTAFSVRRHRTSSQLQVTEGEVEAWLEGSAERARVAAGQRLSVSREETALRVQEDPAAVRRSLAWRQGEVVLDGETLGEAAAEFNRYNSVKIEIIDPSLRQEKLVGLFRTTDPEGFAGAVSQLLPAETVREGEVLRIRRR
ncbi:FecR family protein [Phenylobacterium sp.]|uniref:FecR family protein n=1 Tax=Phenylobacterium sp. TaxID=1871053 RepID=UPI002FD9FBCB